MYLILLRVDRKNKDYKICKSYTDFAEAQQAYQDLLLQYEPDQLDFIESAAVGVTVTVDADSQQPVISPLRIPLASEITPGMIELATDDEAVAGMDENEGGIPLSMKPSQILNLIESGGAGYAIKNVSVNGEQLEVVNQSVDIPVPTTEDIESVVTSAFGEDVFEGTAVIQNSETIEQTEVTLDCLRTNHKSKTYNDGYITVFDYSVPGIVPCNFGGQLEIDTLSEYTGQVNDPIYEAGDTKTAPWGTDYNASCCERFPISITHENEDIAGEIDIIQGHILLMTTTEDVEYLNKITNLSYSHDTIQSECIKEFRTDFVNNVNVKSCIGNFYWLVDDEEPICSCSIFCQAPYHNSTLSLELVDESYTNPFGETYTEGKYLIDELTLEANNESYTFTVVATNHHIEIIDNTCTESSQLALESISVLSWTAPQPSGKLIIGNEETGTVITESDITINGTSVRSMIGVGSGETDPEIKMLVQQFKDADVTISKTVPFDPTVSLLVGDYYYPDNPSAADNFCDFIDIYDDNGELSGAAFILWKDTEIKNLSGITNIQFTLVDGYNWFEEPNFSNFIWDDSSVRLTNAYETISAWNGSIIITDGEINYTLRVQIDATNNCIYVASNSEEIYPEDFLTSVTLENGYVVLNVTNDTYTWNTDRPEEDTYRLEVSSKDIFCSPVVRYAEMTFTPSSSWETIDSDVNGTYSVGVPGLKSEDGIVDAYVFHIGTHRQTQHGTDFMNMTVTIQSNNKIYLTSRISSFWEVIDTFYITIRYPDNQVGQLTIGNKNGVYITENDILIHGKSITNSINSPNELHVGNTHVANSTDWQGVIINLEHPQLCGFEFYFNSGEEHEQEYYCPHYLEIELINNWHCDYDYQANLEFYFHEDWRISGYECNITVVDPENNTHSLTFIFTSGEYVRLTIDGGSYWSTQPVNKLKFTLGGKLSANYANIAKANISTISANELTANKIITGSLIAGSSVTATIDPEYDTSTRYIYSTERDTIFCRPINFQVTFASGCTLDNCTLPTGNDFQYYSYGRSIRSPQYQSYYTQQYIAEFYVNINDNGTEYSHVRVTVTIEAGQENSRYIPDDAIIIDTYVSGATVGTNLVLTQLSYSLAKGSVSVDTTNSNIINSNTINSASIAAASSITIAGQSVIRPAAVDAGGRVSLTSATGIDIYANPSNYEVGTDGAPIMLTASQIKAMIDKAIQESGGGGDTMITKVDTTMTDLELNLIADSTLTIDPINNP